MSIPLSTATDEQLHEMGWDFFQEEDLEGMTEEELMAKIEAEEQRQQLAAAGAPHALAPAGPAATQTKPPQGASGVQEDEIEALKKRLAATESQNATLKQALYTNTGLIDLDSRSRAPEVRSLSTFNASLESQLAAERRRLEFKQKGVDLCIMMDCTGSMGHCIAEVKQKVVEVADLAPSIHPEAITRIACVGYRDYPPEDGDSQFVIHDFGDASNLQASVRHLRACGGGNAEDVTGALKKALELSWSSSTRLLVHFGDAPCHGNKYHNGHPVNGPDTYPAGDPTGLDPEALLRQLMANRIDYHFARIGPHTDIMTDIFKQVYAEGAAATFELHDYTDQANAFLPVLLKSITSSMRRSFRASNRSSASNSKGSQAADPGLSLPALYAKLT